ncbi:MAG TPA: hypothetical protein VGG71_15790 [Chitinophagaceae bacterium]
MKQVKTNPAKLYVLLIVFVTLINSTHAQDWRSDKRINVLFGTSQILLHGFNIEGNFIYKRFIFDYSHGVSLDFKDANVSSDLQKQGLAVHMPWTTGFGIGYRLKEWINIRVEPKFHRFEFYYENDPINNNTQITSYNTFTLGIGLYEDYRPFKKNGNFLRGFLIAPSVRFWPTVSSTLEGGSFTYMNRNTNKEEEITTLDPGIKFTPWIFNISLGYSFQLKRKNKA